MGGQRSSAQAQYSDDSDSETEEYKELEPNINPVTGKWRSVEVGGCPDCFAHSMHCMPINSWADALGVYVRLEVFCTLILSVFLYSRQSKQVIVSIGKIIDCQIMQWSEVCTLETSLFPVHKQVFGPISSM